MSPNSSMVPNITKVLCIVDGTSGHYQEGQIYTYLRHGKSMQAEGVVTLENRSNVLLHTSYEILDDKTITNKMAVHILSQEA